LLAADFYQRARQRCDLQPSEFIQDPEIGQIAEEQYHELWDLLCDVLGEEMPFEISTFTTTANQDYTDVPITEGVYRILRFDANVNGQEYAPLWRGNLATDVMNIRPEQWRDASQVRYYGRRGLRAGNAARVGSADSFAAWRFYWDPIPARAYTGRLWYVPPPPIVIADDSPLAYTSFPDEWPEYAIAGTCAQIAIKQEADPAPFQAEKAAVEARIRLRAGKHQRQQPQTISDHRKFQVEPVKHSFYDRRGL
jgi:hypothetical protein